MSDGWQVPKGYGQGGDPAQYGLAAPPGYEPVYLVPRPPRPTVVRVALLLTYVGVAVATAQFAVTLTPEARREVLNQLTALNDALIETAGYEREARRTNSVDLIDANRAFLETGRAWGICSLEYNKVLVAIGERDAARHNYLGLLSRLTFPQFVAERRQIQLALDELDGAKSR